MLLNFLEIQLCVFTSFPTLHSLLFSPQQFTKGTLLTLQTLSISLSGSLRIRFNVNSALLLAEAFPLQARVFHELPDR